MKIIRTLYLVFANTLALFFFALLAIHCMILLHDYSPTSSGYSSLSEVVKKNYGHMKIDDVDELLNEHASFSMRFAPWVGYREAPFGSRFLNIDQYGIRSNGKPIKGIGEIQNAIWFFGGSTTWGAGVADEETIPAQLEKVLGRPVVNFGVNAFYSEQENLALIQFLRFGYRPSKVVFLDGINESCDILFYGEEMARIFDKVQEGYRWDPLEIAKPASYAFVRLGNKLRRLRGMAADEPARDGLTCERYGKRQPLRTIHAQILAERNALCHLYDLECITFVQPFAGVHGRHEDMNSLDGPARLQMRAKFEHLEGNWRAAKSTFITDALDKLEKHAYIDDVHYSAEANTLIAREILKHLAMPHR